MSSDNSTRTGFNNFMPAGIGLTSARNCMPGNHAVMNQRGGRKLRWRGAPGVWHCAACAAVTLAKRAAKAKT